MKADRKETVRAIAAERMAILSRAAALNAAAGGALSKEYAKAIRRIGAHYKVAIPKAIKRSICRDCGAYLVPGVTASVRVLGSERCAIYRCTGCGARRRYHY